MRVSFVVVCCYVFSLDLSLSQPLHYRFDIGTGKHLEQVRGNNAFHEYGMDIYSVPRIRINTEIGYTWKNNSIGILVNNSYFDSYFTHGPVFTQSGVKEYIRNLTYSQSLLSFNVKFQTVAFQSNVGKFEPYLAAGYGVDFNLLGDGSFPYVQHIAGIIDEEVIQSRTSTFYYRNGGTRIELGLMYYPPLKTRRLQYYLRAGYTHYFRPWGGYESDYYRIYDLDDPEVLLAEVEYSGTTYNRHFSLTIGFERRFGKKKYSREDPF